MTTPLADIGDDAFTHDLVIVGSGSGNAVITDEMDDWRIALVEEGVLGGTCLNRGCIPTKMLVHTADVALSAATGERFGLDTRFAGADWPAVRDRVFGRIDPIATSGRAYRESNANVDLYAEHGRFVGAKRMQVGDEVVTADRFVLAAGARPFVPDLPGLDEVGYHTSDTILRLDALPRHLVVIGGGYVAVELAHVFGALGSEVTLVARGPELLSASDPEVAKRLTAVYDDRFDLHLATDVTSVARDGDQVVLATARNHPSEQGGGAGQRGIELGGEVRGDVLLVATGRVPNSDTLAVAEAGVEVDDDGHVVVDDHQQTNVAGIWALGDLSSPVQLKHKANADARLVAHNVVHPHDPIRSELGPVPYAVFGSPQVASVGLTEHEAIAEGVEYVAAVHDYAGAAYGWALEDTTSAVKVLVDPATRLLLGAHVVGPQAPSLLQPLVQGMQFGQTVDEIARGQWWIHPGLPEVVEQALLAV